MTWIAGASGWVGAPEEIITIDGEALNGPGALSVEADPYREDGGEAYPEVPVERSAGSRPRRSRAGQIFVTT